jgi:hypothetical protein
MERTTIAEAKNIFGQNFIGFDELKRISGKLGISIPAKLEESVPKIPFEITLLIESKNDYILILGIPFYKNGSDLNLVKMREHLGWNPEIAEPCFYNQDWYLKEDFANKCTIDLKWYLIRKELIDDTRGMDTITQTLVAPESLPSALVCAYVFFAYYFSTLKYLWKSDFVWCSDFDNNDDKIYVARYSDPQGISKNGFSIHRHLRIRENYGCINYI